MHRTGMAGRLLSVAAGRRGSRAVALAWLVAVVAAVALDVPGRYADAQRNESAAFLPDDAESGRLPAAGGETSSLVVVYHRDGALTQADTQRLTADQAALVELAADDEALSGFEELDFSPAVDTGLIVGEVAGGPESETLPPAVAAVRERVGGSRGGLEVLVTGEAAFAADAEAVFDTIDDTLLLAAGSLVVVLLLLIYRSPLLVLVALLGIAAADVVLRAAGTVAAGAGLTVTGQSASIVAVLMLGAGTDYALLLIARYREERRGGGDHHAALARALRAGGPAIVASAVTVAAALLCLALASTGSTRGLGPLAALGVAAVMLAMLTLLPALLALAGGRAFWRPARLDGVLRLPGGEARWSRLGRAIVRRPRPVWLAATVLLAVMALGWLRLDTGLAPQDELRGDVESVAGQQRIAEGFSAGAGAPTEVFLPAAAAEARSSLEFAVGDLPAVEAVSWEERTRAGEVLQVFLEPDPYSPAGLAAIPELRRTARGVAGPGVVVGGPTAEAHDAREATARDIRVIVPVTLAVVFAVLAVVLRALVGPLALMASVVLSFAASVGLCLVLFALLGLPAVDPSLPLYAFVFLVALGTDYTIFLMARLREEAGRHGTREAVPRSLAVTGSVITSAGLVLAGTFLVLVLLPLASLIQMGLVIAVGVLLDTFVVRSVLVPAIVADLGERTWWPTRGA